MTPQPDPERDSERLDWLEKWTKDDELAEMYYDHYDDAPAEGRFGIAMPHRDFNGPDLRTAIDRAMEASDE